jgi:23S rRNA A1618 N6-methylase RlmF
VTIDFKNRETLRALTTTLLHKDFGLRVEIPLNRIVPTLPLRLNYLLWIEDLLHFSVNCKEGQTRGVDIGTNYQHIEVIPIRCSFFNHIIKITYIYIYIYIYLCYTNIRDLI